MSKIFQTSEMSNYMERPHVVMYPSIGLGHLIPFLELAKKLVSVHGFTVTLFTTRWTPSVETKYVEDLLVSHPHTIRHYQLLLCSHQKNDANSFLSYVSNSMGSLEQNLRMLQHSSQPFSPVSALITDAFHVETLDVTERLGLPNYIFLTASAAYLCFLLHLPKLLEETQDAWSGGHGGNDRRLVHIPGMLPIAERDLPAPSTGRHSRPFQRFLSECYRLRQVKAILINTFHHLEHRSLHALLSGEIVAGTEQMPSIYSVGPIIRSSDGAGTQAVLPGDEKEEEEAELRLKSWLDKQPYSSVLYVSFGSFGSVSARQIREIAVALEGGAAKRFVWVLRGALPDQGFQSRVEGRGLLLRSWAPQIGILSHPCIGGFLSHCGWNSTLEGIWYGVPLLAWPLYADSEQMMNRLLIVKELKVGLEVNKGPNGMVGREELQGKVKKLMEGEEGRIVKTNIEELSRRARNAVAEDDGSSFKSLADALKGLVKASDGSN